MSPKISTDLQDIETYSNNLVVAPAIGTLVTYFSDERPVPYIAKSWKNVGSDWIFEIRDDLFCENGEKITAAGFAVSLARSIRHYSTGFEHPVFKNLKDYENLISKKLSTFSGISSHENQLIFHFETNVAGGFLEHLTMAPFGYICKDNYIGDNWANPAKIVSSGPYKLVAIENQDFYTLIRRKDWAAGPSSDFESVTIRRAGIDNFKSFVGPKIIEIAGPTSDDLEKFSHIKQIPQNLIVVKLNYKNGVFKNIEKRRLFLSQFRKHLRAHSIDSNSIFKTERFFANDISSLKKFSVSENTSSAETTNLLMKVIVKGPGTPNYINKELTQKVADDFGWNLTVDSEPYESFRETYNDPKYDLYVQTAEIGGGFEGWVIDMIFCSDVGDKWPDPQLNNLEIFD